MYLIPLGILVDDYLKFIYQILRKIFNLQMFTKLCLFT